MILSRKLFILILCFIATVHNGESTFDFETTLGHIKPHSSPEEQADSVRQLIVRVLSDKSGLFHVSVDPDIGELGRAAFTVKKGEGDPLVHITGSSGVAAAWGLNHYLKYFCRCQVSWEHGQQLQLPDPLPSVSISISSQDRFRYYQNVCTLSYSFAWWKWPQWERHLDWMALNGINLPLAFVGQEAIWERVYTKLGLLQSEIDEHFTGPAFFAWGRMGNIRGWGGPLPRSWHSQTLQLQHQILARMRSFGMTPVLPGFAGHVPRAIVRLFPEVNYTAMGTWNTFEEKYCCPYLISTDDPLFSRIGKMFMREMLLEFGSDHVYNCDTFNEMSPASGEESYLASVGRATFAVMAEVDPSAVWLVQNWMFVHERQFWTEGRAKAFITSVPPGRMLVLDLQSELSEFYTKFDSYYGQPFIWCMLHNFGGTLGLYGAVDRVNQGVFHGRTLANSTMVGTGITPEGINQNYVVYDLMLEMSWRREPANLEQWFDAYAARRYGVENSNTSEAWQLLKVWYNASDVMAAWDHLVSASHHVPASATLHHDLVDVGRQSLQLLAAHFYAKITLAFRREDLADFREYSGLLLRLLADIDVLLASSPDFLLAPWISEARSWGTTQEESSLYEWNARNQITLWGPKGEIIDYANKQWAGVVSQYFKPRWELFIDHLNTSLTGGTPFNQTEFNKQVFEQVEQPFTFDTSVSPLTAQGDPIVTSRDIHQRWRRHFKSSTANAFKRQWQVLRKRKQYFL